MKPLHPDAIKMLVVHCSDTPDHEMLRAIDIQDMHLGFGWDGCGYHYVIGRDGRLEAGRPEYWQGAHVKGVNDQSLGVCLIGRTTFTQSQMNTLESLLYDWQERYPEARVLGHRDAADTPKTCPNFDAGAWWQSRQDTRLNTHQDASGIMTPRSGAASMCDRPSDEAGLETEVLFGEQVEILQCRNGFTHARLATDGYEGWMRTADLLDIGDTDPYQTISRITVPLVHVTARADVKSGSLMRLSMGAVIGVLEDNGEWVQIALPCGPSGHTGFIPSCAIANSALDYVYAAESFVGAPYLWGGRTAAGLDCSALVQLALQTVGIACPRNSGDQKNWALGKGAAVDIDDLARGDVLFWPGHVAICQSASSMLHANAHHHAVTSEKTAPALLRLEKATGAPTLAIRLAL